MPHYGNNLYEINISIGVNLPLSAESNSLPAAMPTSWRSSCWGISQAEQQQSNTTSASPPEKTVSQQRTKRTSDRDQRVHY